MVFHGSFNDSKSLRVSRTLLSILADLNNAVIWMVFIPPVISKSSCPCIIPLVTVPRTSITIGITVTFMLYNIFFQFPNMVQVLILLFTLFQFYSMVSRYSKVHHSASFLLLSLLLLVVVVVGLVVWLRLGDPFVSQNPKGVYASHFPGEILGCVYTICSYGQISISYTIPNGSSWLPSRV